MSTQDNIIPINFADNAKETQAGLPPPSFTPPAEDTGILSSAELEVLQGPILPKEIAEAMGQLQSFASETLTFSGLSLQDAIFEVLGPDLQTTDFTKCAWCLKGNGNKPDGSLSSHTTFAGVPLCYDCRGRAAEAFIRLLKKAQEG